MKNSIQKKTFTFKSKTAALAIVCAISIVLTILFPMSVALFPIIVALGICIFAACMFIIYILVKNIADILVAILGTLNKRNLSQNIPVIEDDVIDGDFKQVEASTDSTSVMIYKQPKLDDVDSNKHVFKSVVDDDLSYLDTPAYLRIGTSIIY